VNAGLQVRFRVSPAAGRDYTKLQAELLAPRSSSSSCAPHEKVQEPQRCRPGLRVSTCTPPVSTTAAGHCKLVTGGKKMSSRRSRCETLHLRFFVVVVVVVLAVLQKFSPQITIINRNGIASITKLLDQFSSEIQDPVFFVQL
jgi:hypothetical protein